MDFRLSPAEEAFRRELVFADELGRRRLLARALLA